MSRARYLSIVAEENHVLQWQHSPWAKTKEEVITLQPTGINVASTFNGFCSHHDTQLFQEIDNAPFCATYSQIFAQVFRAHARELYCKQAQILSYPDPADIADFHGLENPENYARGPLAELESTSMDVGLRDTILHHERLQAIQNAKEYHRLRSCVIPLSGTPVISTAGAFFPDFNATGKQLQDFTDLQSVLNSVHFSILPTETGAYAVFSFLDTEAIGPENFVFSVIEHKNLTDMLLWVAFTYIENTHVRPSWWNALGKVQQDAIKTAMGYNMDIRDPRLMTIAEYPNLGFTNQMAGKPFWL
ncbi:hypothetical protein [Roseimicrobium gellanilyticum]|uniref:hypothetical protein n=1 Tax=Roseimicrobium gellanilyticum TaxID=748857 RepID=UPI001B869145|nr:hypothetical protein [Roseimicrobium gellanilyticum]